MTQPGRHGSAAKNPDLYNLEYDFGPNAGPETTDGRFGRLFAIGTRPGEMAPHPLPQYDLRRLGSRHGPLQPSNGPATQTSHAPAGITFLGQFIDHDITLDVSSSFTKPQINARLRNQRTPNLDLDCVYGAGREASPHLYDGAHMVEGEARPGAPNGQARHDLPRTSVGRAIIGDPRNDENIFVAQIQAAFIRFHNKCVDYLHATGVSDEDELFERARDTSVHYFHRIVLEDFLYHVIGLEMLLAIAGHGRKYYFPHGFGASQRPFMPVEFSVAAYRYGHSTVRDEYVIHTGTPGRELFDDDLRGFQSIPSSLHVDWDWFFVRPNATAEQFANRIDPYLPNSLFTLPFAPSDKSLPGRNLMRGRIFRLPAGETIAAQMIAEGVTIAPETPMTMAETLGKAALPPEIQGLAASLRKDYALTNTPLWLYVLMEASVLGKGFHKDDPRIATSGGGDRLGPVGGRIVGEVLMGLLDHYRDATGKGLDYRPDIPSHYFDAQGNPISDGDGDPDTSGIELSGMSFGPRMSMRALIDFAYS